MFERTLALVSKYRRALDQGPKHPSPAPQSSSDEVSSQSNKTSIKASIDLPSVSSPSSNIDDLAESAPKVTLQSTPRAAPAPSTPRKVLFATGGITNGRQAREILDAGASVAQVYTAMIYGGAGTITRIKQEMRDDAKTQKTIIKNQG